jgi:hypothetical protein
MMASEDPMVEVPMVFASSSFGALNSLAIIETQPAHSSVSDYKSCSICVVRTVLDIGADGILFIVDEVLGKGVATRTQLFDIPTFTIGHTYTMSFSASSSY